MLLLLFKSLFCNGPTISTKRVETLSLLRNLGQIPSPKSAEYSIDSAMINEEHISTANNTLITDQNDHQTFKNEIDKLWKAIDAIKRKFELPANLSQVDALQREIDEYKLLKCAEYEDPRTSTRKGKSDGIY